MRDLCENSNKNEKDVYQLDFEVCYECWMNETNPNVAKSNRYLIK